MIFTVLQNVCPLQNFDFLQCRNVTMAKLNIVKVIPTYAKVLHSD